MANSDRALRGLETASPPCLYLPPDDVRLEAGSSLVCEWKGAGRFWHLRIGDVMVKDAAWSYPEPWLDFEAIAGHLAILRRQARHLLGRRPADPAAAKRLSTVPRSARN